MSIKYLNAYKKFCFLDTVPHSSFIVMMATCLDTNAGAAFQKTQHFSTDDFKSGD